jgi:hypothetical protein
MLCRGLWACLRRPVFSALRSCGSGGPYCANGVSFCSEVHFPCNPFPSLQGPSATVNRFILFAENTSSSKIFLYQEEEIPISSVQKKKFRFRGIFAENRLGIFKKPLRRPYRSYPPPLSSPPARPPSSSSPPRPCIAAAPTFFSFASSPS